MLDDRSPQTSYGQLPPVMRVLDISSANGEPDAWLADCLANDSAMAVKLEPASLESAMALLRQEVFEAVIVQHQPGKLDAIAAIGAIRAASPDFLAMVVIGEQPEEEMMAVCFDASADAYICKGTTDVRTLLWVLARAGERQRLLRESHESRTALQQQRAQQHQKAIHQLRSQRSLLLEHIAISSSADPHPPSWLVEHFLDLLRIFVVSGTGTLRDEVTQLVANLEDSEVTLAEALTAHTLATENLILGLGNRPAWHILGRANLLAYELVMQLQRTTV